MVVSVVNKKLVLDYQFGLDFCRALEKCSPKNDFVYFSYDGNHFSMFAQSHMATVYGAAEVQGAPSFHAGIDSPKFVALFKKLYKGSDIVLSATASHLTVTEDNIKVRFPVTSYIKHATFPKFHYIEGDECAWLAKHLHLCEEAIGEDKRFPGVLVDATSPNVGRVLNFSTFAIRSCAYSSFSFPNVRFVVPPEMCMSLGLFSKSLTHLMVESQRFGGKLKSGVYYYMSLLSDGYPRTYADSLGLLDRRMQVSLDGRKYVFKRERLLEVLDLVAAVVGTEEHSVLCSVEGVDAANKRPVWLISASTYSGLEASERVECLTPGPTDMIPFRVNKKHAIGNIKVHQEHVVVYDKDETHLIVTDETCSDVTVLLKAPA